MTKITLISAILLSALSISCKKDGAATSTGTTETQTKLYTQLEKATWFLGSWGHTSPEGTLAENWIRANDSVFNGESYFIVGKDTVFTEFIELAEANGKLTYTVSVKDQNNEAPVPFVLTASNEKQLVFENPQHDFPNKITYNKITEDSLVAIISGTQKGKPATEIFAMKRQK